MMFDKIISIIKTLYPDESPIPLHAPRFRGNEKEYLADCIDSTFVSYVGQYVTRFEDQIRDYTGSSHALALVNGTSALHLALRLAKVTPGTEVITQPLTFVATANAISFCNADPVFVDVEESTLGMNPDALEDFLNKNALVDKEGNCRNKITQKRISACVPMHTFGHACRIDRITEICKSYQIPVVEDAAESLGSFYKGQHTGTFGDLGILSFNGNKPVTTGGGGIILTRDKNLAKQAKHLSTTAKIPHPYAFDHDEIGFNYRMPNINAAVGCAQMERFPDFLADKRETAAAYTEAFKGINIPFMTEPERACSNYWLNAIFLENQSERDEFIEYAGTKGVQARPVWKLMNRLPMFNHCLCGPLDISEQLCHRIVNIPSSVKGVTHD